MKILAFDTATDTLSVALNDVEHSIKQSSDHLEKLIPEIKNLLSECATNLEDIDLIAVGAGPGSFTGLRIGISTAKTLSQFKKIKLVAVPTLDTLAYQLLPSSIPVICPIIDAKKHKVYTAVYNNKFERLTDYLDLTGDELLNLIKNYDKILVVGNGIKPFSNILKKNNIILANEKQNYPNAKFIVKLSENYKPVHWTELEPLYIRASDAEKENEQVGTVKSVRPEDRSFDASPKPT